MSDRGISVRSGSAIGSREIRERVQRAKDRAIQLGIASMLAKHLNSVAFKTGDFANSVENSYDEQRIAQRGKDLISIRLERSKIIAEVPYGEYHINPGGNYGTFYENPTTPGTKPIDEFEWNRTISDEVIALLPAEMLKEDLIVTGIPGDVTANVATQQGSFTVIS